MIELKTRPWMCKIIKIPREMLESTTDDIQQTIAHMFSNEWGEMISRTILGHLRKCLISLPVIERLCPKCLKEFQDYINGENDED
jgi:hypothetical protein